MKAKIVIGLVLLVAATLFQTSIVAACDCAGTSSVKEAVEKSSAVFVGRAIEVDSKTLETKFELYRYWKGAATKTVILFTRWGNCSYFFKQGEDYLVYAREHRGTTLTTDSCTRTTKLADAEKDLAELGTATEIIEVRKPLELKLNLVEVADTRPTQFLLALDKWPNTVYTSLESLSLRELIHNVDDGTIITWDAHKASHILNMFPDVQKQLGDVKAFAAYCKQEGVVFTLMS